MTTTAAAPRIAHPSIRGWLLLLLIVALGLAIRLLFFRGPLGSDDVVYLTRALDVAEGAWTSANYIGSLRYGFNIPAGFLIYLLGRSEFTANLFSLICSLLEIGLVYAFAWRAWGVRSAILSAGILASLPLHIAVATDIHADSVAAFAITLSILLFWRAEATASRMLYLVTGLAIGYVFWVKQAIIVYVLFFLIYAAAERRWSWRWVYVVAGGVVLLVGDFALMAAIAGDPFHVYKVSLRTIDRAYIHGSYEQSAFYYFRYLFADPRHTGLVPYLAALALVPFTLRRAKLGECSAIRFVVLWALSLLAVFSLTPISLAPLSLIAKQSNYLSLFFAPIALMAGWLVAQLGNKLSWPVLAATVSMGVVLGALEQQSRRVFTANSRAVLEFVRANPEAVVYASTNNQNIATFYEMIDRRGLQARVRHIADLPRTPLDDAGDILVVIDPQTLGWGRDPVIAEIPRCWEPIATLEAVGFGAGRWVAETLRSLAPFPPIESRLTPLIEPEQAIVYRIDRYRPWCE